MNLCLFDLDDTLLPFDSDRAWGEFMVRLGWVDEAAFRRENDAYCGDYRSGQLDIHAYIAFATAPLRKRSPDEAEAAHARFMREVVTPQLRPPALEFVRGHQSQGDRVVVVTATNDFITGPIACAFGIADLIAVRLERGPGGTITGRIVGVPSFREGKVRRVEEWLAESAAAGAISSASASTATPSTTWPSSSTPPMPWLQTRRQSSRRWHVSADGAS